MSNDDINKSSNIFIQKYKDSDFVDAQKGFTQVSRNVIQNCKNIIALQIWLYLQSKPESWRPCKAEIIKHFNISLRKYERCMGYLCSANLIEYHKIRNAAGKITDWNIYVLNGSNFIEPPLTQSRKNEPVDKYHSAKNGGVDKPPKILHSAKNGGVDTGHMYQGFSYKLSTTYDSSIHSAKNPGCGFLADNIYKELKHKNRDTKREGGAPTHTNNSQSQNPQNPKKQQTENSTFSNDEAQQLFENKFRGYDAKYDELFAKCREHYESKGSWVTLDKWKTWIQRERLDSYTKLNAAEKRYSPINHEEQELFGRYTQALRGEKYGMIEAMFPNLEERNRAREIYDRKMIARSAH